jgi:hypothetical protein
MSSGTVVDEGGVLRCVGVTQANLNTEDLVAGVKAA